jgi:hypothetical protein
MAFSFGRRFRQKRKDLSIVVVAYNMARELPRTLLALSAGYQRNVHPDEYEVIVVDNGSDPPVDRGMFEKLRGSFRLLRIDSASPSPAPAVNRGLAAAEGEIIGVMIDGARIVTPGVLHFARHGAALYRRAVVATLGWYLGHDLQSWAMRAGYDRLTEDRLLASIAWPEDGYRLFEIGTMDESSFDGWLQPIGESNALFMRREMWHLLGGMDERFDYPGGGLANIDLYRRAGELPGAELVILLGEGTFHQIHGGTATNAAVESFAAMLRDWTKQYEAIRGVPLSHHEFRNPPTYLGMLPRPALARFTRAAIEPVLSMAYANEAPLGPYFDRELWACAPPRRPSDPAVAAVVDLAHEEFRARRYESAAALSRLVRQRAPDEPEPQRILSLIGSWLPLQGPPIERRARCHFVLGKAHSLLGDRAAAAAEYEKALALDPSLKCPDWPPTTDN